MPLLGKISLSTRMLLSIGGAVLLAFGTTITVVAVLGERDARASAMALARQTALTEASRISNEINQASAHARGLAATLSGIRDSQKFTDRDLLNQLLRQNLEKNPNLLGVWCVWEPNALDNKDAAHVNAPGSDAEGRYVSYWNRVGGVHMETCVDYDKPSPAGDYYLRPLKSGNEVIMEPAVYKIGGKDVMVVSICMPIRSQDKTLGVAGVDFSMEQFQGMVSAIKPYDTGYGFLLANNGAIVAYPEASAVGKDIAEVIQDSSLGTSLKAGTDYHARQLSATDSKPCQVTAVPIQIGETGTPWMLGVATPEDKMLAAATYLRDLCILIGGGALLAVLGIVWLIARQLSKPLVQIAEGLNAFADQLAGSANEVAQTGNAIAQGASESAAAIEETSASMQEINSIIARNASSSVEASQVVKATSGLIENTHHKMAGLKTSMDDISASSRETQQIVKTIDEIAFQTNILALNAAVEAARAGEAGAGFAVVADEVRNLAQRAAEAARNTSSLIEGSVGKIASAAEMSGQTSSDFTKVNQSSKELAGFITQIADSSGQQQSGIAEVTKAVNELNHVVQRNAALAEESSAAAQELNAQASQLQTYAHNLKDLVGGDHTQQAKG